MKINGNGNKLTIQRRIVGKIKTNKYAETPNTPIVIRVGDCCHGHLLDGYPGNARDIFAAVLVWRKSGHEFYISDKETVISLADQGIFLKEQEVSKDLRDDLIRVSRQRQQTKKD
jgi:hypothetical protein